MQHTRIVAMHLRGRAALAAALAAAGAERERAARRLARRCAARIERDGAGWGGALAALLHAGIDAPSGARGEEPWLRRAIDETGAHGLALFKRRRREWGSPRGERRQVPNRMPDRAPAG